jgi:hypothetical protein
MTSLQTSIKQVGAATAYYVPIADARAAVFSYRTDINQFSTAVWAQGTGSGVYSTFVATNGAGLLKDMGKTIVSSSRTFRKIQLVAPNSVTGGSTFGVAGAQATVTGDYLTGYIEVGFDTAASPPKFAKYGL